MVQSRGTLHAQVSRKKLLAKHRVTLSTQSSLQPGKSIRYGPMNLSTRAPLLAALAAAVALTLATNAAAQRTDKSARHFEDALRRFEINDLAGAAIQLKNALQQDPSLLAAYVLLGRIELARGDAPAAESAFAKAIGVAG